MLVEAAAWICSHHPKATRRRRGRSSSRTRKTGFVVVRQIRCSGVARSFHAAVDRLIKPNQSTSPSPMTNSTNIHAQIACVGKKGRVEEGICRRQPVGYFFEVKGGPEARGPRGRRKGRVGSRSSSIFRLTELA